MRELSLHLLDLLENSLEAGATELSIDISEDTRADRLVIEVQDNGQGMTAETARQVTDPFFTSRLTRRVGLGLPLLAAAAERCGGCLKVDSEPGKGSRVRAEFGLTHIDRAPMGDLASTLLSVILHDPSPRVRFRHRVDDRSFSFDTNELLAALDGIPLSHPAVWQWLKEYLAEGQASLCEGETDAESTHDRGAAPAQGRGAALD